MTLNQNVWPGDTVEGSTDPATLSSYTIHPGSLWVDTSASPAVIRYRNSGNTAWVATGASSSALGSFYDTFTATTNQTSFTLTHPPASLADLAITLNSIPQDPSNVTGLSTNVVTVNTGLNSGDTVSFRYTRLT